MDTTIYLDYLINRFQKAGVRDKKKAFASKKLDDVDPKFDLVINCAGIGARELVRDVDLEPHRGQVAIVPKIDNLTARSSATTPRSCTRSRDKRLRLRRHQRDQ